MKVTTIQGEQIDINLRHTVFAKPNGDVCCNGKIHRLVKKDAAAVCAYIDRLNAAQDRADKQAICQDLSWKGRIAALLVAAKLSLVRIGGDGLRELREDVFDAASNKAGFGQYAAALMGGEPYAVWT